MEALFKTHQEISEADYNKLWENCLFVFDANVLLDLYRLPESARKDLLNIFLDKKISGRTWVPFQVFLEFTHNKLDVIADQKTKFDSVRNIINGAIVQFEGTFNEMQEKLKKLQLKKRHSVINPDPYVNENLLKPTAQILNEFLSHLDALNKKQPDVNDKDAISKKVTEIFKDKIGNSPSREELKSIYDEGESRYKEEVPPGFNDKTKPGFYMFEDKKFIRKFGDLVFWKEIIKKCKEDSLKYVILVTGDVKDDWWNESRGKKIGPRYELLNEIYFEAKSLALFHMYDTSSFMQYAKQYLKIEVKEQSIAETKDLLEFTKDKNLLPTYGEAIDVYELIKDELKRFPQLRVTFAYLSPVDECSRYLVVSRDALRIIIVELLSNANQFAKENTLHIRFSVNEEYYNVTFKNETSSGGMGTDGKAIVRSAGLRLVSNFMRQYGQASIRLSESSFYVVLRFEKRLTIMKKDEGPFIAA